MKTNNAIKNVDKVVNCQTPVTIVAGCQLPVTSWQMSIDCQALVVAQQVQGCFLKRK